MKIVIFTDHAKHSSSNSFYGLANELFLHKEVENVTIVSRGIPENEAFFRGETIEGITGMEIKSLLKFPFGSELYELQKIINIKDFDCIFLRLPRPIHDSFFGFIKEKFSTIRIINDPKGITETSNKSFLLNFKHLTPPIALVSNLDEIRDYSKNFEIVLKPLEDYGGRGLIRVKGDMVWENGMWIPYTLFEQKYMNNPSPYLAMKFLKNVDQGDKRIVVVNGKILCCSLRLPAKGKWLCNIAQGGSDRLSVPDDAELKIVKEISPVLLEKGIFYYGLDTLVNDDNQRIVSEINTLSIGGISTADAYFKEPLSRKFAEELVTFIDRNK